MPDGDTLADRSAPAAALCTDERRLPRHVALPRSPWAFLARYVRRRAWRFGGLFLIVVSAASCAVGVQYGMKLIVDTMNSGPGGSDAIWRWLALFLGLIGAESLLWRLAGWLGCLTVVSTGVDIRLDLFRHLTGHPVRYFSEHLAGALGGRITATAGASGGILSALIWRIVPPIVDFLGAVVVLVTIDPWMSLAMIFFVALIALLLPRFSANGRPLHSAFAAEGARVNGELVDVVANVWTVKAFSARAREQQRLQHAFGIEAAAQRRSWLYVEKARVLHDVCLWLMAGSMLLWAIQRWRSGVATPGDVVVISALTFRILHGSRDTALALVDVSHHTGVISETLAVIAKPPQLVDAPGAREFRRGAGRIELQGVCFGYGNGPPVLRDFSLIVPAGQRLGVVGPSGAGKSTLVALLQRLDDVRSGTILIDGQRIAEVTQDSLRRAIAVVPQEIALFHRSVAENIRYGRASASDAEMHRAADLAGCSEFIEALPDKYDTEIGERGVRLSGGQRQRLGLARAFVKDAPILILDEATSALDSRTEEQIQQSLGLLMRGRTVVSVAHRLASVSSFDRVVVVVDGRIVEDGSPAALRHAGGVYASMWRMQAEGYETL